MAYILEGMSCQNLQWQHITKILARDFGDCCRAVVFLILWLLPLVPLLVVVIMAVVGDGAMLDCSLGDDDDGLLAVVILGT